MCCTFEVSKMSNTKLYAGQAEKNGKTVHVLAYQNEATSSGPNAMVIPFPTSVKMTQDNIIDTSEFKNFLTDITNASKTVTKGARFSRGLDDDSLSFSANFAEVFDVGSYTVILADNVNQIPEALGRVPKAKRPNVSSDFLIGYGELYPDQPIAVCCWDGAIEAEPLLWWYEPTDTTQLFIPTMDAHDGRAPKVGQKVDTDHTISVGAVGPVFGNKVRYSQKIPTEVADLLPTHVHGHRLPDYLENNDCFVKTSTLHQDAKESYLHGALAVEIKRGSYKGTMGYWH